MVYIGLLRVLKNYKLWVKIYRLVKCYKLLVSEHGQNVGRAVLWYHLVRALYSLNDVILTCFAFSCNKMVYGSHRYTFVWNLFPFKPIN